MGESMQSKLSNKALVQRLLQALDAHEHAPKGRGQQKWIREELAAAGVQVTAEAVSRWFSAEARPRPAVMHVLARILRVKEEWLSLGLKPELTIEEERARNALVAGVVNVAAGFVQLNGGHIAFPQETSEPVHFYAILGGRQYAIHAALGERKGNEIRFVVPNQYESCTVLGVVQAGPLHCEFLHLTAELIDKHKVRRGGYVEVAATRQGADYVTKRDKWPRLRTFAQGFL
jgi:hypothetical protein